MLSQLACEVASGVCKVSGVAVAGVVAGTGADVTTGSGVSVISGVLVVLGVGETWGVLVAVGMANAVCVCRARAVEAICVKIGIEFSVGETGALPPPQADRPTRSMAIKNQGFSLRWFTVNLHFTNPANGKDQTD